MPCALRGAGRRVRTAHQKAVPQRIRCAMRTLLCGHCLSSPKILTSCSYTDSVSSRKARYCPFGKSVVSCSDGESRCRKNRQLSMRGVSSDSPRTTFYPCRLRGRTPNAFYARGVERKARSGAVPSTRSVTQGDPGCERTHSHRLRDQRCCCWLVRAQSPALSP